MRLAVLPAAVCQAACPAGHGARRAGPQSARRRGFSWVLLGHRRSGLSLGGVSGHGCHTCRRNRHHAARRPTSGLPGHRAWSSLIEAPAARLTQRQAETRREDAGRPPIDRDLRCWLARRASPPLLPFVGRHQRCGLRLQGDGVPGWCRDGIVPDRRQGRS